MGATYLDGPLRPSWLHESNRVSSERCGAGKGRTSSRDRIDGLESHNEGMRGGWRESNPRHRDPQSRLLTPELQPPQNQLPMQHALYSNLSPRHGARHDSFYTTARISLFLLRSYLVTNSALI